MELEDIMLSEVSQAQKDKGHVFSLICGRQTQKINIYTKTSMTIYKNSYVEHVCNSGTTLRNSGGGKGKENDRTSVIS
jgi:hypothetical protein